MTLEQIDALILDDYRETISHRIWNRMDPKPEDMPEFLNAELEAEFEIYKAELIAQENERLRKEDLENRFENLNDKRLAFHTLHPDTPNPALWLKELLSNSDSADAESKMAALEVKDLELKPSAEEIKAEQIKRETRREISIDDFLNAWLDNNTSKMGKLRAKRAEIKARFNDKKRR